MHREEIADPFERKKELEKEIETRRNQLGELGEGETSVLKIWSAHREISRLAAMGYKQQEICRELNLSTSCVWNALNKNPLVKERIAVLQGEKDVNTVEVGKKIKALQGVALEIMEDDLLVEGVEDSVKLRDLRSKTALKLLEMGGNGPIKKVDNTAGLFSHEDMKDIKKRVHNEMKDIKKRVKEIRERNITHDILTEKAEDIEYVEELEETK